MIANYFLELYRRMEWQDGCLESVFRTAKITQANTIHRQIPLFSFQNVFKMRIPRRMICFWRTPTGNLLDDRRRMIRLPSCIRLRWSRCDWRRFYQTVHHRVKYKSCHGQAQDQHIQKSAESWLFVLNAVQQDKVEQDCDDLKTQGDDQNDGGARVACVRPEAVEARVF